MSAGDLPFALDTHRRLDRWLRFEVDGTLTVFSGRVEIGQGIGVALAQIVAHELRLSLTRLRMAPVETPRSPDEGYTAGSRSIEEGGAALRQAAAQARQALVAEASRRLGVAEIDLVIDDGLVTATDGRTVSYWDMPTATLLAVDARGIAPVRPWLGGSVIGVSAPRPDVPMKLLGSPAFVQDLDLPGMLHGRVVRPPGYHARLTSLDDAEIRRLPGVIAVVQDGSFVGVIAEREEQAIRARDRARRIAVWHGTEPPMETSDPRFLLRATSIDTVLSSTAGEAERAGRDLDAEYTRPYIAHASIGPSCAVALRSADAYTVWSHTQGVYPLRRDIAAVLRQDPSSIVVKHMEGAGCYGHNCADDVALDAVLLARAVPERAVRVQLMRDDEFAWEPYGPAMVARLGAKLDQTGLVVEWSHHVWSNGHSTRPNVRAPGNVANALAARHLASPFSELINDVGADRNATPLYRFPSEHVVLHTVTSAPLRVSALRALGAHLNVFAIESFMDELAALSGTDPVAFRLRHLSDPRARRVVETAAARSAWGAFRPDEAARGRGMGFARYKNVSAYVAVVAEVEVDRDIAVRRVWAVVDAGVAINPDGLVSQIEGGVIQAVSWTLKEQVRADANGIATRAWSDYPILSFPEVPEVEVTLIDSDAEPVGAGEAAQGPTSAAIANAVYRAIGLRVRDMPFTRDRLATAALA